MFVLILALVLVFHHPFDHLGCSVPCLSAVAVVVGRRILSESPAEEPVARALGPYCTSSSRRSTSIPLRRYLFLVAAESIIGRFPALYSCRLLFADFYLALSRPSSDFAFVEKVPLSRTPLNTSWARYPQTRLAMDAITSSLKILDGVIVA